MKQPPWVVKAQCSLWLQLQAASDLRSMEPMPRAWPRLRKILEAALPLPAQERRACVVAASGADQALAGRVEDLLAAHQRANGFLEGPARLSSL
jgi:hypothetical protein